MSESAEQVHEPSTIGARSDGLAGATVALRAVPVPSSPAAMSWWAARKARRAEKAAIAARRTEVARLPPLPSEEVRAALCLRSGALVDELHAIVVRMLQVEDQREGRLDAKAQGLLITAGLSLTVAFTLGGMWLQHPETLAVFGRWDWLPLASYALALVLGLSASFVAVRALYVTNSYSGVSERDLLHCPELALADKECEPGQDIPRENAKALALYRRLLILHYWHMWQDHIVIHNQKGRTIKHGQRLFLGFLVTMILVGGSMAWAASVRQ